MTQERFLLHRHWQVSALVLLLLVLSGCGRITDPKSEHRIGNLSDQNESTSRTWHFNATLDRWMHSQHYLLDSKFQLKVNYKDAYADPSGIELLGEADTETLPVHKFYTLLNLCVMSRDCARD